MEDEVLVLAPKGIASLAMKQVGLVTSSEDPRIDGFWTIFERMMREHGYVADDEEGC